MAGRQAAQARQAVSLGICMVLQSAQDNVTNKQLQPIVQNVLGTTSRVTVYDKWNRSSSDAAPAPTPSTKTTPTTTQATSPQQEQPPHYNTETNQYTRTILIRYHDIVDKTIARQWHGQVIDVIVRHFSNRITSVLNVAKKPKPIRYDINVYLPTTKEEEDGTVMDVTLQDFTTAVTTILGRDKVGIGKVVTTQLISRKVPYRDPKGRWLRVFRLQYKMPLRKEEENTSTTHTDDDQQQQAMIWHNMVIDGIPQHIPGVWAALKPQKNLNKRPLPLE
jgi:hypothetical protein